MQNEAARNRRRQRAQQRQMKKQRRNKRMKRLGLFVLWTAIILSLCGLVYLLAEHLSDDNTAADQTQQTEQAPPADTGETVIHLSFAGDLNVTDKVVASGETGNGYDYTPVFMDLLPLFASADATALNFEGNLCGEPYGTKNASAPKALIEALSAAGVDYIQMANSYSIHNGILGLTNTLDGIRQSGMEPMGAYSSSDDYDHHKGFTLRNICGVKVAFVAFTKGMDSLSLPAGKEDCVNLLYTDYTSTYQNVDIKGIREILNNVALEKPDITIAMVHWGSEYNSQVSGTQEEIVALMKKEGVDAIIGTHSHYVQKIDYDETNGSLVAYSLGDFFGDGERSGTAYSIVLDLEITRNNETGNTKITGFDYEPIYNLTTQEEAGSVTRLLRIRQALADYEANGIGRVSEEAYTAMKNALSKLDALLEPQNN